MRWRIVRWAAGSAISGTNWAALAPVPMTTTRWPSRSRSWSHRAEWNVGPVNVLGPRQLGDVRAVELADAADDGVGVEVFLPALACTRRVQRIVDSSSSADRTSVPKRISGRRPKRSAMPRKYSSSTSWVEKCCGQSSRWAKE